jgi:hypothetical protein
LHTCLHGAQRIFVVPLVVQESLPSKLLAEGAGRSGPIDITYGISEPSRTLVGQCAATSEVKHEESSQGGAGVRHNQS